MSITTHFSSIQAGEGNLGTKASVPNAHAGYCKHYWPCDEGSGNIITDGMGDRVVTDGTGATWIDDGKAFKPSDTTLGDLLTGSDPLHTLSATKSWAVILLALYHDNAFLPNQHYIQFGATAGIKSVCGFLGPGGNILDDGVTSYNEVTDDGTGLSAAERDGNTIMSVTYKDESDNILRTSAIGDYSFDLPNSNTTPVIAINPIEELYITGAGIYGMAMFEFANGFPSDWDTGLEWMRVQWLAGNKILYPSWVVIQ